MRNKQINTIFSGILIFFALFIVIPAFLLFKNAFTSGFRLKIFLMFLSRGSWQKPFLTA